MPTGYTAKLVDEEQPFDEFALTCARAFGALVDLRDQSLSTPVPEKIEANTYYHDRLTEAKREIVRLQNMTAKEQDMFGHKQKDSEIQQNKEAIATTKKIAARLDKMIARVNKWTPPTTDHEGLKDFMLEQLESTRKFDGDPSYSEKRLSQLASRLPQDYYVAALNSAIGNIKYYEEEVSKTQARATDRTEWIQQLRKSLK